MQCVTTKNDKVKTKQQETGDLYEIGLAIKRLKNDTAPYLDKISAELLKDRDETSKVTMEAVIDYNLGDWRIMARCHVRINHVANTDWTFQCVKNIAPSVLFNVGRHPSAH